MKLDISRVNLVEKDIEDYLWENPEALSFYSRDGEETIGVEQWISRQLEVPSGIIDLFGVFSNGNPVIVEVKNVPIDGKAVAQILRYEHDVWRILCQRQGFFDPDCIVTILVGPSIDTKAMHECMAAKIIPMVFEPHLNLGIFRQNFSEHYEEQVTIKRRDLACKNELFSYFDDLMSSLYGPNTDEENTEHDPHETDGGYTPPEQLDPEQVYTEDNQE